MAGRSLRQEALLRVFAGRVRGGVDVVRLVAFVADAGAVARVCKGCSAAVCSPRRSRSCGRRSRPKSAASAQALFGVVAIAGPAIGPTLGGYIVTNLDWRWIFFINLPIGIIAIFMAATFLPADAKTQSGRASVDWWSLGFLAAGLGAACKPSSRRAIRRAGSTLASSASARPSRWCVWGYSSHRQLKSDNPVVDLRVLRYRSLWAGCIVSAVIGMGLYGAMFAVPIFAQTMMHYTSQQTGMLMLPGALASAVAMPVMARLLKNFDPRVLVAAGSVMVISALWMLSHLNPQTGEADLFWPLIIRGFGTVAMFLPMSMATFASVPVKDVAKATGLYNLTRQLGGSMGIAVLTTLLSSRTAFHRSVLIEKLGSSDVSTLERVRALSGGFLAKGFDAESARQQALTLLDGSVTMQATVMSFADSFWLVAAVFVCTMPLLFLLGGKKRGPTAAVADAH
ncbi:MAG: DHA2 family efflux MFS transporter permease subunit [Polyangiaceae bacterium]